MEREKGQLMTEKLYFDHPLQMSFTAQTTAIQLHDDGAALVALDRTCFYPTGGGQRADRGKLNGVEVLDVQKVGDVVWHLVAEPIKAGDVVGELDADYRIRNMQAHTGQHLLSATFDRLLSAPTVSVKMSAETPNTVDLQAESLTDAQLDQVERAVNRVILENRPVKSYFLDPQDIPAEMTRREIQFDKISGPVRIVEIDEYDTTACGGTHFPSTAMVGLLKILKVENHRGKVRVTFVVGELALETFQREHRVLQTVSDTLSTGVSELPEIVEKLQADRTAMHKQLTAQRTALLTIERNHLVSTTKVDEALAVRVVERNSVEEAPDAFKEMTALFAETDVVALMTNVNGADIQVAIAAGTDRVNAGQVLKAMLAGLKGGGGGSPTVAQGIAKGAGSGGDGVDGLRRRFWAALADHS